jgi:SAM-dependent methyltransferase
MRLTSHAAETIRNEPAPPGLTEGSDDLLELDENLHYARAWHRYGYCFRRAEGLRVLDAGCGTGRTSRALARLNPRAFVLGIDASAAAVRLARRRAEAETGGPGSLRFAVSDPARSLPEGSGRFDFVIARGVLDRADDPCQALGNFAQMLDPRGLLLITFPARDSAAHQAARALRRVVDALAPAGAGLEEQERVGLEVVQALRPDHPIRAHLARPRSHGDDQNGCAGGLTGLDLETDAPRAPDLARAVLDALTGRDWTLNEAVALLEEAGLTFLYAATPWRWRPDRAFDPEPAHRAVLDRVEQLEPAAATRLIDALDPSALGDAYHLYACPAGSSPSLPDWPRARRDDPGSFDRLIPHPTGLARVEARSPTAAAQGRTLFRTVSGSLGELDRISALRLAAVDGRSPCGAIDRKLTSHTRASDDATSRQECWINLADSGLIVLEPPELPDR